MKPLPPLPESRGRRRDRGTNMKAPTQKQMLHRTYDLFRGTDAYRMLQRLAREPVIRLSAREQSDIAMVRAVEKELGIPTYSGIPSTPKDTTT